MAVRTPASIVSAALSVCLLLLSSTQATAQNHLWSKSFGGAGIEQGSGIAVDAAGNVVVTGHFNSVMEFGGWRLTSVGDADIFIAKFDSTGKYMWSQNFGDTRSDHGNAVAIDHEGNVFVTGFFHGTVDFGGGPLESKGRSDVFIAKYDSTGAHLWSHNRGGLGPDEGLGIAVDRSGAVFVTGWFTDTVDLGGESLASAGNADVFIIAYDAEGRSLWATSAGGPGSDAGTGIATDSAGNVIVTGYFSDAIDFGGGSHAASGNSDVFVVKLDPQGNHLWSRYAGSSGVDNGWGVATSKADEVVVTGSFQGTVSFGSNPLLSAGRSDLFVTKYSSAGAPLWSRSAGDFDDDDGWSVTTDHAENVLVTGRIRGNVDFGEGPLAGLGESDVFVAAYDSAGTSLSSARFGDADAAQGMGIAVSPSGSIAITGDFRSSLNFGGGLLTTGGETDMFVARFGAPPTTLRTVAKKSNRGGFTLFVSFGAGLQQNSLVDQSETGFFGPNIGIGAFGEDALAVMARFAMSSVSLETGTGRSFSSVSVFLGPSFQGWFGDRFNLEVGLGWGRVRTGEIDCSGGFLFPRVCSEQARGGPSLLLGSGYSLVLADGLSIQLGIQYFVVFVEGTNNNLSFNLGFQVL